jgi:hypothetical protein
MPQFTARCHIPEGDFMKLLHFKILKRRVIRWLQTIKKTAEQVGIIPSFEARHKFMDSEAKHSF